MLQLKKNNSFLIESETKFKPVNYVNQFIIKPFGFIFTDPTNKEKQPFKFHTPFQFFFVLSFFSMLFPPLVLYTFCWIVWRAKVLIFFKETQTIFCCCKKKSFDLYTLLNLMIFCCCLLFVVCKFQASKFL